MTDELTENNKPVTEPAGKPEIKAPSSDADMIVLMGKMQQQLIYLEKKIDAVLKELSAKSSGGGSFSGQRNRRDFSGGRNSNFRGSSNKWRSGKNSSFKPRRDFDRDGSSKPWDKSDAGGSGKPWSKTKVGDSGQTRGPDKPWYQFKRSKKKSSHE